MLDCSPHYLLHIKTNVLQYSSQVQETHEFGEVGKEMHFEKSFYPHGICKNSFEVHIEKAYTFIVTTFA